MYGLLFLGGIVILLYVRSVSARVSRIEKLLKSGAAVSTAAVSTAGRAVPAQAGFGDAPSIQAGMRPAPTVVGPSGIERFGHWLREDWLLKLGALLLLIGFGWLTTYAFLNNWIGPMGRIALGIVAGASLLVLGWWRIQKYINQGGIFLVLGSTTILLTVFAARAVYGFFTPFSALALMFLSTAFVAFASVKYRSKALSLLSLILAGVAPLLTDGAWNETWLFSYLLVVVLGAVWVVAVTGIRELTTAALILVALHSAQHYLFYTSADKGVLLLFVYAFAGLFFLTNTAGMLRLRGKDLTPDIVTAAGNGMFLLAWIMRAAPDNWQSLIIAAWMLVFAIGAFLVFRVTQRREPFYAYAGVSVMFLAAATSAELSGATLTIAYTIECVCVALAAYFSTRDVSTAGRLGLLLIVPMVLSIQSINSYQWVSSILHRDFFVLLTLSLALFCMGLLIRGVARQVTTDTVLQKINALYFIFGSIYAYTLLWLSLHAVLKNNNTAVMISLIIYTVVGLFAYFYGRLMGTRGLTVYGGALIGFVVARLLFVEVWNMDLTGKIITFFAVGALLMSTAFIGRKKKDGVVITQQQ